ncbi:MAG: D-alanine--D-alanine ligase, partial [Actinomycetota bacterium]|nr:D-alanine--D-alanine ligase [Actinomycetota bacterium]
MTSRHVLVLSGGLSPERDVSLRSGRRVADALRDVRPDWHVAEADVDAALLPYLQQNRPDCIVPLLHGAAGEDGALRDLLETLDIDYV